MEHFIWMILWLKVVQPYFHLKTCIVNNNKYIPDKAVIGSRMGHGSSRYCGKRAPRWWGALTLRRVDLELAPYGLVRREFRIGRAGHVWRPSTLTKVLTEALTPRSVDLKPAPYDSSIVSWLYVHRWVYRWSQVFTNRLHCLVWRGGCGVVLSPQRQPASWRPKGTTPRQRLSSLFTAPVHKYIWICGISTCKVVTI